MDTRRFLTTLLIVVALFLLLNPLINKWRGVGNQPENVPVASTLPYVSLATTAPATAASQPSTQAADPGAVATTAILGNATAASTDKLALTVDSVTAGVDLVQLNIKDYAETVRRKEPLTFLEVLPGAPRPFATTGVHITPDGWKEELNLSGPGDLPADPAARAKAIHDANTFALLKANYIWKLVSSDATHATFRLTITDTAEIDKTFTIDPASYDITVTHTVRNLSNKPFTIAIDQLGPTDLPRDNPQTDDRSYDAANLDTTKKIVVAPIDNQYHAALPKFPGLTHTVGSFTGHNPLLWTANANRFFVAITRPLPASTLNFTLEDGRVIQLTDHVAEANLDAVFIGGSPLASSTDAANYLEATRLTGAPLAVPAGGSLNLPVSAYLGPKSREILNGDRDAAVNSTPYNHEIYAYAKTIRVGQGGMCGFCTFDWLAFLILRLLDFLHSTIAFHNYGIAIMLLVLLVRAALHPLTRSSQINMAVMGKKMKDIQPLLEASKKKYAKDSKKQSEEQMRIYRENNVNPAGPILGCLPMFLQTPIWIALYAGLRVDIDLRHAAFIPGWINDLSNPDTILPHPAPAMGHPLFHLPLLGDIYGLNLLPILLIAVYYFNMKAMASTQPTATDPNQAQMQKMSKYMIFLFPIFLYNAPSGLNLYIFASTLGGLVDTWIIRRHLKARGILPQSAADVATPNPLV